MLLLCSLQELLLCPAWRIQDYVTLLQALQVHTHRSHPDYVHLSSALEAMLRLRESVNKVELSHIRSPAGDIKGKKSVVMKWCQGRAV